MAAPPTHFQLSSRAIPYHEHTCGTPNWLLLLSKETGKIFFVNKKNIQRDDDGYYVAIERRIKRQVKEFSYGRELFREEEMVEQVFLFEQFQPFEKIKFSPKTFVCIQGKEIPITFFTFPNGMEKECYLEDILGKDSDKRKRMIRFRDSKGNWNTITMNCKPFKPEIIDYCPRHRKIKSPNQTTAQCNFPPNPRIQDWDDLLMRIRAFSKSLGISTNHSQSPPTPKRRCFQDDSKSTQKPC